MEPIRMPRMKMWNQFADYNSAAWFWKREKSIGNLNNNKQNKKWVDMWNGAGRFFFFFFYYFPFDPSSYKIKYFMFGNKLSNFFFFFAESIIDKS